MITIKEKSSQTDIYLNRITEKEEYISATQYHQIIDDINNEINEIKSKL